ncbi:unnamed protein product [Adineta ricciae]|uniref:Uncharacterized protein n=1 Tax=Adineta ricciae TaxID=249248 RepID=A0A816AT99_ADIRI|nr:unnamed protein product [Adineta ricciae]CAF1601622.1 unnamed protein product [Adineta ricciae]
MKHKSVEHLLEAIQQGKLSQIISLIKYEHNIYVKNKFQQNLLVYILQQQRQKQDLSLIQKRFQIFKYLIKQHNLDIHSLDSYGKNLFNWATNLNCTKEALFLLNSYPGDIDLLVRDQSGSCSLHYAVEHGNEVLVHAIVNYLLRYRLRFDIKDAYDNTPEDLAMKLGYEDIHQFLNQACPATIYMARELPSQQAQIAKVSPSTSVLSEYYSMIETRIGAAKSMDDWKTVIALRAYRKSMPNRKSNQALESLPQPHARKSSIPSLPSIVSSEHPPATNGSQQSEQMLRLFELHLSPSFRRSFVPVCQRTPLPIINHQRSTNGHHKIGHSSPGHMLSNLHIRKTDSDPNQTSSSTLPDPSNHLTIPPIHKQHRQTLLTTN